MALLQIFEKTFKWTIIMVFSVATPTGLLNKVWFELCLHFCRRGREKQRELKPEMFALESDNLGKRYIHQVSSEVTKNPPRGIVN
jgi:hypothetical protein